MSIKVLFLTHKFYPDIGGIEVNSEILANAFHMAGCQVHLVTWTKDASDKVFPFQVVRNPNVIQLFQQHLWADVVYENNPNLRLAWPAIFFSKPSVIALRTWINRINGKVAWQDRLKFLWLRKATSVIAVSEAVRVRCWPTATVIGNPYRALNFAVLSEVSKTYDFVFLGRLVSDKGATVAIKALHLLSMEGKKGKGIFSNLSLTIIGDGPERELLENLSAELGIKDNVRFMGPLQGTALVACLNQHRFLLVPSIWEEPFGNVALEGMACGCLPIVSDGGGLPDAVGNAGLIFQRGNVEALVLKLKEVLENPALEKKVREAAPKHLAAHHPEIVSYRYLQVIKSAISSYR